MSELREAIARAAKEHRDTCVVLALKAGLSDSNGEEIRTALDKADTDLMDAILPLVAKAAEEMRERAAKVASNEPWCGGGVVACCQTIPARIRALPLKESRNV